MNITNCSTIHNTALLTVERSFDLMESYHWFVVIMAVIGFISLLSAVLNKSIKGLLLIGYILAIPVIIILSFINKKKRAERKKDLKEIGAYIKSKCQSQKT